MAALGNSPTPCADCFGPCNVAAVYLACWTFFAAGLRFVVCLHVAWWRDYLVEYFDPVRPTPSPALGPFETEPFLGGDPQQGLDDGRGRGQLLFH